MVSLLQEFLGEASYGSSVAQFIYLKLGDEIRQNIRARARLLSSFTSPNIVSHML